MQFVHYVVFGVAWLRKINFVTQPNVELYKSIANRLHAEAQRGTAKTGIAKTGIAKTKEWRRFVEFRRSAVWRGRVTLRWDRLPADVEPKENATRLPRPRSTRRCCGVSPSDNPGDDRSVTMAS